MLGLREFSMSILFFEFCETVKTCFNRYKHLRHFYWVKATLVSYDWRVNAYEYLFETIID